MLPACHTRAAIVFLCLLTPILDTQAAAPASSPLQTLSLQRSAETRPSDQVQTRTYDWLDVRRNRPVPVKIYYPRDGAGPWPVIVFSHGLGGSREGYEYLGRYWAGHGYVSVHLQHVGSDNSAWQGKADPMAGMRAAVAQLANAVNRPQDVSFVIDQLIKLNEERGPLQGRLDTQKLGMAGHSFGAYTTLMIAGQKFVLPTGRELSQRDPRIKAAIAMSSGIPKKQDLDAAFAPITIPMLFMTGTLDTSPINDTTPEQRRMAFDHARHAERYLVTFTGGDHMVFSGRGRLGGPFSGTSDGKKDGLFQGFICRITTAFWDAHLKGDAQAKAWLDNGAVQQALGADGTLDHRKAEAAVP